MRLHRRGEVAYQELPYSKRTDFGFDGEATAEPLKANSLLHVAFGHDGQRCVVESNDSFFVMSHLVDCADKYFCAGYNREFFENCIVPERLSWQSEPDTAKYRDVGAKLIERHGKNFQKVRPFIPIAPNLGRQSRLPRWRQKLRNARYRLESRLQSTSPWFSDYEDFEDRYAYLLSLRGRKPKYDIVLLDTMWGWPGHRLALHERLGQLASAGHNIRSRLTWHEPSDWDNSQAYTWPEDRFPIVLGQHVDNYEAMLAESRIAAFATGFHFGWRNIMTLALMIGVPVHSDHILLHPWFDLDRFRISWNDDADWSSLVSALETTSDETRQQIALHNTRAFDELMSPESTARYFLNAAQN
jgi:hypothetical protein